MTDSPDNEGIVKILVDDEIAFLDQALSPDIQYLDDRLVSSFFLPLPLTVASTIGCDRYGNLSSNLLHMSVERKFKYVQDKARHFQEVALGVH